MEKISTSKNCKSPDNYNGEIKKSKGVPLDQKFKNDQKNRKFSTCDFVTENEHMI